MSLILRRLSRSRVSLTSGLLRPKLSQRPSSSARPTSEDPIDSILSKPTWSVQSLIPDSSNESKSTTVTPKELRHLLRLAALPQPANPAEETEMLQTLESQIHFVKEIQRVDTSGVSPLRRIYDETEEAQREQTIGLADLKPALDAESRVGRLRRIRRAKGEKLEHPDGQIGEWDPLEAASKKNGRFFVVQSGSSD